MTFRTRIEVRGLGRACAIIAIGALVALPGCGDRANKVRFDGNYYPAKLSVEGDTRKDFRVTVRSVDRGLSGAREAGRYEATRYCLEEFGTSSIEWTNGPDAEDERLQISNGSLVLTGECVTW